MAFLLNHINFRRMELSKSYDLNQMRSLLLFNRMVKQMKQLGPFSFEQP
jgi:hypothetical protein